jgi:uncharacterized protein (TIGR02145 family)
MKNKNIFNINISLLIVILLMLTARCNKDNDKLPMIETDSVTDIDGNVYKTVKIGNQWWMASNLKTKRFRNGDSLILVEETNIQADSAKWHDISTAAYCKNEYGFLYNFCTIEDSRKIAPTGWHVPSDDEWKELEIGLGMSKGDADLVGWRGKNQGNKLKLDSGWYRSSNIYEVWGTNESGFSAVGGGCRMFTGSWGYPGTLYTGFWWTTTKNGYEPWYRYLDYNKPNVFRYYGSKLYGFNIRCVKD